MKQENEKYFIFSFLAVAFIFLTLYSKNVKNDLENERGNFKGITIGYATRIKSYKNSRDLIFYFYKEGKRHVSKIDIRGNYNDVLKKYYKVTFDEKNAENNFLDINRNLEPDSLTLVKAGFTYTKVYDHDFRTDTYKLRHEWK